ncbi:hypothetical protein E3Q10_01958 [Wallemia mellicola]|uniref:Uncharacterized protein n=1 Tax=Wallemia mellicola TaxID=1708541 RepID=A0A4T0R1T4_9BASI|nr:hypothetical protein E3Q10_01958 [Wallemia mellicola]
MSKLLEFYNVYVYHLSSLHRSSSNPVVSSITVILLNSSNATPWQPVVKFNGYYPEYLQTRMVKLRIAYRNLGSGESIIGKVVDRRGMRLLHFCIVTCLMISQPRCYEIISSTFHIFYLSHLLPSHRLLSHLLPLRLLLLIITCINAHLINHTKKNFMTGKSSSAQVEYSKRVS